MPSDFYKDIVLPKKFDKKLIERAYLYAKAAHKGQKRRSGDEYITHPVAVGRILLEMGMSAEMVAAAMLHDVAEDTKVTLPDIEKEFGPEIRFLVEAVSNLRKIDFSTYSTAEEAEEAKNQSKNESLRDLFLAMAEDVRVVIIKLADRLHNMQTLKALQPKDQKRIARETLNVYAPLALRLGIGDIKGKLEDLAFPTAYPAEYKLVKKEANTRYKAADRYALIVKRLITDELEKAGIGAKVEGRAKHIYSLYKKITRSDINWDFDKIYDLVALRIITGTEGDCYKIMGLIHRIFRPLPGQVKDYIAAPKPNGYRSIHTTVFGPEGKIFEIQIRTYEMHEEAEFGVASHMHYTLEKNTGKTSQELDRGTFADKSQTDFLKQIKEWQNNVGTTTEFLEGLKLEFLDDRIYVFSPNGDIFDLPVGATPIDFAYEVHSRVGDSCTGAKVNGRIAPLSATLHTRDVVEILTGKKSTPKRGWLEFVKTSKARQHIRSYLRHLDQTKNITEGAEIVAEELKILGIDINKIPEPEIKEAFSQTSFKTLEDLYASVGEGLTTRRQAVKIILGRSYIQEEPHPIGLKQSQSADSRIEGVGSDFRGMKINLASCCNPTRSDSVICYVTRGRGLTVHRRNCYNLASLEPERLYRYNPWLSEGVVIELVVMAENRVGLLRDITDVISQVGANIEKINNTHLKSGAMSKINLKLVTADIAEAAELIRALQEVETVTDVRRI
jgi:GTP pyrophosphokinase